MPLLLIKYNLLDIIIFNTYVPPPSAPALALDAVLAALALLLNNLVNNNPRRATTIIAAIASKIHCSIDP